MKRNRYTRRCVKCHANRAVWAWQACHRLGDHLSIKIRPTLCDDCVDPKNWRPQLVVLASSAEACADILHRLSYAYEIPSAQPIVLLENPRARFMVRRESIKTLSNEVLLEAGHPLYCSAYASEYEETGKHFPPGSELTEEIPPAAPHKLLQIMQRYELQLADAWGVSPKEVFEGMGLDETEWPDALYYTLMSCLGHGVGLQDDYGDAFDKFNESRPSALDAAPFHTEGNDLHELALTRIERLEHVPH